MRSNRRLAMFSECMWPTLTSCCVCVYRFLWYACVYPFRRCGVCCYLSGCVVWCHVSISLSMRIFILVRLLRLCCYSYSALRSAVPLREMNMQRNGNYHSIIFSIGRISMSLGDLLQLSAALRPSAPQPLNSGRCCCCRPSFAGATRAAQFMLSAYCYRSMLFY